MKIIKAKLFAAVISLAQLSFAYAEGVVVIVNKENSNSIDKNLIVKIYTGDSKNWPGGGGITPYDLPEDSPQRASFSSGVMGKSVSNMKALWAQNIFSGKAAPPKAVTSDDEVKKAVSSNKSAIGYINASSADGSVKVVLSEK
jgi:ABC-type phosphate transport system substrate-binding protein